MAMGRRRTGPGRYTPPKGFEPGDFEGVRTCGGTLLQHQDGYESCTFGPRCAGLGCMHWFAETCGFLEGCERCGIGPIFG